MLRYWSSLRYSFLRTLFLSADELRRQPTPHSLWPAAGRQVNLQASWEYAALSLLSNIFLTLHGEYVFTYYCGAATRIRIRVFRLVYLVYDMHAYIFKVTVFTKQA